MTKTRISILYNLSTPASQTLDYSIYVVFRLSASIYLAGYITLPSRSSGIVAMPAKRANVGAISMV